MRAADTLPRVTRLSNGMRVATDPVAGVETVSAGVWIEAGARDETPAVNGASHFLEHMLFKGTQRRSAQRIVEEIEDVGGHINAYTAREHTAYYVKLLADDLPLAVDVIADLIQNSTLDAEEFERERQVILQEIHQSHDTPDDIIFDIFQETAFPGQPLGFPVMGGVEGLSALDRAAVAGHRDKFYAPGRMVLAASGQVDHDTLVALAEKLFTAGAGGAGDGAGGKNARAPARYTGGEARVERKLEQVHLVTGLRAPSLTDDARDAAAVYATMLGGGMSSRLFQEVREKRGLAYAVHAYIAAYDDTGVLTVYAAAGPDDLGELLPVVCEVLKGSAEPAPEAEINRAKAQLRAGAMMMRESTSARCEQLARQLLTYGRPVPLSEIKDRIEAVDAHAVRRAAEDMLASPFTVTATGPLAQLEPFETAKARLV
ncbi:MAG: M16 family metallopeptidase [Rhodospirillales bacterium]